MHTLQTGNEIHERLFLATSASGTERTGPKIGVRCELRAHLLLSVMFIGKQYKDFEVWVALSFY